MTSPDDAAPVKLPPPSFSPGTRLVVPKTRLLDRDDSDQSSISSPVNQNSSSAPSTLLSSATSDRLSRSSSPNGRLSLSIQTPSRSSTSSPGPPPTDDIRSLIIRSFSPVVGVYASSDTEQLMRQKGFKDGFRQMIRPFGENVMGKVVIRDSVGAGRGWDDYGVRFVELGAPSGNVGIDIKGRPTSTLLDEVLDKYFDSLNEDYFQRDEGSFVSTLVPIASPAYKLFLRRLLSSSSMTPHETFIHPVACIIAISSRNASPIESLRQLYANTSQGDRRLPQWANMEYLRYYVLVHDEDRDDITKSISLFDQMKRHFGLHCHLLRIRSDQCVPTDDDSVVLPASEWMGPIEDLAESGDQDLIEIELSTPCLFESDVTAIKTFVREMVTQSVVPHMENRVAFWNDQVASRRRGISGRFMSMSKRWTGFGSSSRNSTTLSSSGSNSSGNFDAIQGFYRPDAPEAVLRKMADYAFMLRDWKLSTSTYELLRTDFGNDKAWKYLAGANEMLALSTLLNPQTTIAKMKLESVEQMLETASYSYLTRCSDAQSTLRCLIVGVELLKIRGGSAAEEGAKWAIRILETGLTGMVSSVLITERVAACYASKIGVGTVGWGSRKRKAAFWTVLATDGWLRLGKPDAAKACLETAEKYYSTALKSRNGHPFGEMKAFLDGLRHAVKVQTLQREGVNGFDGHTVDDNLLAEETSEKLDLRQHRKSLIGVANSLDAPPLSPIRTREEHSTRDDDFE